MIYLDSFPLIPLFGCNRTKNSAYFVFAFLCFVVTFDGLQSVDSVHVNWDVAA